MAGLASAQPAPAARLAILDLRQSGGTGDEVGRYLSDVVRVAARDVLPQAGYLVMTRENVLELMPPGTSLVDCVGDCSVEIGRKIQADYVVSGELLQVGSQLRVSLSVFDCRTANLMGQAQARGPTEETLETDLLNEASTLLLILPDAARDQRGLRRQAAEQYRASRDSRSRLNRWIAVGAVAGGGYAAYAHIRSGAALDDYHAVTTAAEAATQWDLYTTRCRERDIAIGVTGALVAWRVIRALRDGPSEDDFYRDLLLKNRLSSSTAVDGAFCQVTVYSRRF
jgi:hypothetical protein